MATPLMRALASAALVVATTLTPAWSAIPAPDDAAGATVSGAGPEAAAPLPGEKQVACGLYMLQRERARR